MNQQGQKQRLFHNIDRPIKIDNNKNKLDYVNLYDQSTENYADYLTQNSHIGPIKKGNWSSIDGINIDNDSHHRTQRNITRSKQKHILKTRLYNGAYMGRKLNQLDDIKNESMLLYNNNNSIEKKNKFEVDDKSLIPYQFSYLYHNPQNINHVIMDNWGGQDTRMELRRVIKKLKI